MTSLANKQQQQQQQNVIETQFGYFARIIKLEQIYI